MSDSGRFMFYAAQPSISSGDSYNSVCNHQEEHAAILGCYANNRIYIYDVTDSRLDGIKEVTASHEMLHAVYQRLSQAEKDSLNRLLDEEYEKLKTDQNYSERMAYYARAEPGQRNNELHSIIGTEIANIDPALERHYQKYFNDRSKLVSLYKTYSAAFTNLDNKKKELSSRLDILNNEIEQASEYYAATIRDLNSDIEAFNANASSGVYSSQAQLNRDRQLLVNRSNELVLQQDVINQKIVQYNKLRDEYNKTATQSSDLYKSIDSTLAPAPKV